MRRTLNSAMMTVAAVPALLAVPVTGPLHEAPHPVTPRVVSTALTGVDAAALAEDGERPAAGGSTPSTTPGPVAAAAVAARPAVLTPRRTTRHFDLVAVTWRRQGTASGTRVEVRVRERGVWSGWQPLEADDEEPEPGSAEARRAAARTGTVPLLTDGADGVQVRVDTATGAAPGGLTLDLVDAGRSDADDGTRGGAATAAAATARPGIVTRAQWGADERLVKETPVVNTAVKTLVLHHTATTNSYSAAGAPAQIRAVYAYHTKVRGWNDIGYNFLVDRFGRIYEGRRGSLTSPVMGAHTGGFNSSSLGVSVLGTYSDLAPSTATVRALTDVMAWQAAQYGINPRGATSAVSTGGSATKYKAGTSVRVSGFVGHRDLGLTECPGKGLYGRLSGLRAAAAARMVPGLAGPALDAASVPARTGSMTFSATVPTRQRWSLAVTPLCGGSAVRVLTGTASGRIGGTWDLRDSTGQAVPPGAYTVTVATSSPVGSAPPWQQDVEVLPTAETAVPSPDPTPSPSASPSASTSASPPTSPVATTPPSYSVPAADSRTPIVAGTRAAAGAPSTACPVQRVAGTDTALTSVVAGRTAWPAARAVVLANATGSAGAFAEALAVAPFAVAQGAPLLLTGTRALPDVVARDIVARKVTTAWVVGSASSVTPAVEQQLRALGVTTVTRVSGSDRWATAAALATRAGAPHREAVLVSGDAGQQLDALVAAASAAGSGRPVLLTSRTGVPAATLAALTALKVTSVTVIGSDVTIPEATLAVLPKAGVTGRTRVVGSSRWSTAVAVAAAAGPRLALDRVVLTSGLVAGPDLLLASAQGRALLLSRPDGLPAATASWLSAHRTAQVRVVAPPELVRTAVLRAAQATRGR